MPRYRVELTCLYEMKQAQDVEAASAVDAEQIAKERTSDHEWRTIGEAEGTVETVSIKIS